MNASTLRLMKSPFEFNPFRPKDNPRYKGTNPLERESVTDSMVLAVLCIATVYWFLDSILNIFFSNKFNLIAELIGPDLVTPEAGERADPADGELGVER